MRGGFSDAQDDMIYKFDQCMAKRRLSYYAECTGWRHRWTFTIWVCAYDESVVREIITRITSK